MEGRKAAATTTLTAGRQPEKKRTLKKAGSQTEAGRTNQRRAKTGASLPPPTNISSDTDDQRR
jgi:hypothetical protein